MRQTPPPTPVPASVRQVQGVSAIPAWYTLTWASILTLIAFPPVGWFLMWRYRTEWSTKLKGIITVVTLCMFIGAMGNNNPPQNSQPSGNAGVTVAKAPRIPASAPERAGNRGQNTIQGNAIGNRVQQHSVTTVRPRSAKETITSLMEEQFGDRLRNVEVDSHPVGKKDVRYTVRVEFNNSIRWDARATKGYMEGDMQDAYKAIYTSGFPVSEARMDVYGSGTDKFGKRFTAPAYITALDGEVAAKIDWSNHRAVAWDDVWKLIFRHRQYEPENLDRDWAKEAKDAKNSTLSDEEIKRLVEENARNNPN